MDISEGERGSTTACLCTTSFCNLGQQKLRPEVEESLKFGALLKPTLAAINGTPFSEAEVKCPEDFLPAYGRCYYISKMKVLRQTFSGIN